MKVGLQLYSIRDFMEKDVEGTLQKVKEMGYDYVEFAGYFEYSAAEIRGMLNRCGLECISVHQKYEAFLQNGKENAEYIKTIGAKYCAIPWMGKEKQKGSEAFDRTIEEIKQVGSILKDVGITLLYHNHDFEFERFEGKFLLDWLYEGITPELLQTEIDTCWVRYAGYDPVEYVQKYAGRSPIVHLKDFSCENMNSGSVYGLIDDSGKEIKKDGKRNSFAFKPLGQGIQDFPSILKACEDSGVKYVIVEQDSSLDRPSMESAKMSRDYLASLGI